MIINSGYVVCYHNNAKRQKVPDLQRRLKELHLLNLDLIGNKEKFKTPSPIKSSPIQPMEIKGSLSGIIEKIRALKIS